MVVDSPGNEQTIFSIRATADIQQALDGLKQLNTEIAKMPKGFVIKGSVETVEAAAAKVKTASTTIVTAEEKAAAAAEKASVQRQKAEDQAAAATERAAARTQAALTRINEQHERTMTNMAKGSNAAAQGIDRLSSRLQFLYTAVIANFSIQLFTDSVEQAAKLDA